MAQTALKFGVRVVVPENTQPSLTSFMNLFFSADSMYFYKALRFSPNFLISISFCMGGFIFLARKGTALP